MRLLVVDFDTPLVAAAAQQQVNRCNAIHKASGREKLFESKTDFNKWLKDKDKWTKEDFEFEVVSEVRGESRFAFHSIKQKVDKILDAAKCDDFVVCIEGEGNFRRDFESKYVDYKGQRAAKPLLFEECRDFFINKYKSRVILSEGRETDDTCNIMAWDSYNKYKLTGNKGKVDTVLAYIDKDLAANSRGWMLNYNKLENGIFWNDGFQQSYNFATQLLIGDSADNIPGILKISNALKKKFEIKVGGVGPATAKKILSDCKTNEDLVKRVKECYYETYKEDDWKARLDENGFFLYLLRNDKDSWCLDKYLGD